MDELSRQGIGHFNGGRFAEALRCFRAALERGAHGPEVRCLLAHTLDALGQDKEALCELVSTLEKFPRHQPAYSSCATLLLRRGAQPGSAAVLRGALALKPMSSDDGRGLVETLRLCARAWQAAGDLEAAHAALRKALALGPQDKESRLRLIEILHAREQRRVSMGTAPPAERELQEALALGPGDRESRRRLADIRGMRARAQRARLAKVESFITAGDFKQAVAALRSCPDPRSRRRLAEVRLMIKFKRSLARSETVSGAFGSRLDVKLRPQFARIAATESREQLSRGRIEHALFLMRRAQALQPRGGKIRLEAARIEAAWGREQMSREQFRSGRLSLRRALALHPRGPNSRSSLTALLRVCGEAWLAAGRTDLAEKALRRALALEPKSAVVRGDLARVLRTRQIARELPNKRVRFQQARRAWEAVLKLDPRDSRSWMALSLLMRWIGGPEQEQASLRRAVTRGQRLSPAERFKALMRLGRFVPAVTLAEKILNNGLTLVDFRAFSDPWEKDNRPDRKAPQTNLDALARSLRTSPGPWREFYLGSLGGPKGLRHFDALPSGARYRWMHYNAAMEALFSCSFHAAIRWFNIALRQPMDWRAHGYLAEAYVCVDRPEKARREMARGLDAAPENEKAQVYAWWGELELWLGDYARSLELTTRACAMGAPFAHGWKGAALLKLGRREEALAQLDAALRLYPNDEETLLWRAEAKRELGRFGAALEDLKTPGPRSIWVLFNSALAKHGLGDEAGMRSDFELLPAALIEHVRGGRGARVGAPLDVAHMVRILESGLKMARGFRRSEYAQSVWLSRRA